jgi:hypothetical protein
MTGDWCWSEADLDFDPDWDEEKMEEEIDTPASLVEGMGSLGPAVQGRKVRSDIRPATGSGVTSSTRRTSHGPVRVPCTVVALSRSPDPSKTDFRVREWGATKITETIEGKE